MERIENFPRLPLLPFDSLEEQQEWIRAEDSSEAVSEAWKGVALSLYVKGRHEDALASMEKAVKWARRGEERDSAECLHKKAVILLRMGEYQRSLEVCGKVEQFDADGVYKLEVLYLKSFSLFSLKEDKRALSCMKKYVEMCRDSNGWDESRLSQEDFDGVSEGLRTSISDIFLLISRSYFNLFLLSFPSKWTESPFQSESWPLDRSFLSAEEILEKKEGLENFSFQRIQGTVLFYWNLFLVIYFFKMNFFLCVDQIEDAIAQDTSFLKMSFRNCLNALKVNPVVGEASLFLNFLLSYQSKGKREKRS